MDFTPNRRRILELAGTGTALSLAGCSALRGPSDNSTEPGEPADTGAASASQQTTGDRTDSRATTQDSIETGTDGSAGGDATVTVAVQADQQRLQQRQREIQSELEAGNISREEAQQQARQLQVEFRTQAVASFRERASSTPELSVEDSVGRFGVVLVSGSTTALIDSLAFAEVNALLEEATFQRVKSQAQQQLETATASN